MLRTVVSLLAVLPTLLPPGICVCQFVPPPSAATAKAPEAPRRQRCTCCRHAERPTTVASTRPKAPAHGWNLPPTPHDTSCPAAQDTPLPRLANIGSSQLVMAVDLHEVDTVHLRDISLELLSPPRHLIRFPAHLGFSVLLI
jgi:hypothetical protein